MSTITYNQVQELVKQIPITKLERVYNMILEVAKKEKDTGLQQLDFMKLPVSERRKIMKQQARQMITHYEKRSVEREAWQGGDFIDDC